jgi:phosphonate transport system substrate-binding protein
VSVPTTPAHKSPFGVLAIPLVLVAVAGGVFAYFYFTTEKLPPVDPSKILDGYLNEGGRFTSLAAGYADANGDLVADTPAEAAEPAELYFTEIPSSNPDADEKSWEAFLAHLSRATGKPCKYLKRVDVPPPPEKKPAAEPGDDSPAEPTADDLARVRSFGAQLAVLKAGKLHVTAFTTGQVRQAVNTAGFVPLFAPADKDGRFHYQIEVLVAADSPVKTVAELKNGTLAVPALSSNSGAKAPLVLFHDEFKLNPRTDLNIKLAGTPRAALQMVAEHRALATCIASDLLARELAREPGEDEQKKGAVKLTADQFKRLYKSGDYPKLCFGVSHTLPQPLVDKIKAGFESFRFDGTAVGEKYKADGAVKFRTVDYKQDWDVVRKVDDRLVEILKKGETNR